MLDSELESLRDKYKLLIQEKEEILNLKKKIEVLEQIPEVKEYIDSVQKYKLLKLKHLTDIENKSNSYFVKQAVNQSNITPSDDYYVYIGTYKYTDEKDVIHGSCDIEVNRDDESADYVVYYNLEAKSYSPKESIEIPYNKSHEFEQTHKIIIPKNLYHKKEYFYDLQDEYFETLILKSKSDAIEKINKLVKK